MGQLALHPAAQMRDLLAAARRKRAIEGDRLPCGLDRTAQRGLAADDPCFDERLALPESRPLVVVGTERRQRRNEQSVSPGRPKPGIDLVEAPLLEVERQ